ncbi:hypothetical protein PILCRDRAFT_69894 [Piloderma croceum F 1598]|uniref:FAD-binding PCMH-type domain-containing protein n=1 Tax=Piloderma croceum (strain F 1598) TaxID=765440 RepID=A0A0C3BA29_PILCF|nr:hypothetical protein PILCRDRAFT_69894 [Piloderma croceum F 1598]
MSEYDLTILSKAFKGDVVTPKDSDYAAAIARWASNASRNAKIVAFVKDAEDVSLALKFVKANNLPLAIKGGGHSTSGASSSEGGLVIDLSRHVNGVRVDAENKLAYVGGGALWADFDQATIKHGLAGVGGTVNHTGVGGCFGWLSGSHGLVIDNLVKVTIVTADGSILTASSTENADLFWGIRGGGCNFGVITEFVYKVHPQRKTVYAGSIVFALPMLEKLIAATDNWWEGHNEKEGMIQILTRDPDRNPCIIVILFYNGTEAEGRAVYKSFFDIGPVADMTCEIPFEMLNAAQSAHVEHGLPTYMKGVRITKLRFEVIDKVFKTLIRLTEDRPDITINCMFEYHSLLKICSVPNDATAFIRVPYPNTLNIFRWTEDTDENLNFAREASREITDILAKGNEGADIAKYGNYGVLFTETMNVNADQLVVQILK